MARASYLYLMMHKDPAADETQGAALTAGFTVKWEAQQWLSTRDLDAYRVEVLKDGGSLVAKRSLSARSFMED